MKSISKSNSILLIIIFFIFSWNIWLKYPLWNDELLSISNVRDNFINNILEDWHPPLYFFILKIWTLLFGSSEFILRLLSLIFGLLSIFLLNIYLRKFNSIKYYSVFGFYITNWTLFYYSHEVRMYSLLILLSLIVTIQFEQRVINKKKYISYYFFLYFLSLTHFIGLIYAGSLLLIEFIKKIRSKEVFKIIIIGVFLLIYPLFHFIYNFLYFEKNRAKLQFINFKQLPENISFKFNQFLECNFKLLHEFFTFIDVVYLNATLLFFVFLFLILSILKSSSTNKKIQLIYFFIILIVLLSLFILDLSSNIYNYVILLPVISLYFGEIINQQYKILNFNKKFSSLIIILILFYFIGSFSISYTKMIRKWSGSGTFAGTSNILSVTKNCDPYCLFFDNQNKYKKLISNMYINQVNYHTVYSFNELLIENNIIFPIILNYPSQSQLNYLKNNYTNWRCYILSKSFFDNLVIYLPPDHNKPNFIEHSKKWHLQKSCF